MLGGVRNGTSSPGQETVGYSWSSTAYSIAASAYSLRLENSGNVNPAYYYVKYFGRSLRCLAEGSKNNK